MRSFLVIIFASACFGATDLSRQALEIFTENCLVCHGAGMAMSKLDLRSMKSMLAGGERGPALVPGSAEKSRLFRFTAGLEQPSMPPGKKLPTAQIEILKQWIDAGATFPEVPAAKLDAKASLAALEERPITEQERRYWAFQAPVRHPLPPVRDAGWVRNPIDAFLLSAMESKGLRPSPEADKRALVRRVYLDLIGLPPTPSEVQAFVRDTSPTAYEQLIERLLQSPYYGERWGRHWLDLVRYADSGGYEVDRDRPNAWRYRDYVIQAWNADKPYDQFIREQIAGDEIAPESHDALIATGLLRHGPEANIKTEQTRMDELDDIVATTSTAFLGMTVGCARCHNHKFDPIPQKDYYRIQAVFFPAKYADYPLAPEKDVEIYKARQKRIEELQTPLKKKRDALERPFREKLLQEKKSRLPGYIQTALQTPPEKRTEGQKLNALQVEKTLKVTEKEVLAAMTASDLETHRGLDAQIEALDQQRPQPLPTAMGIREDGPNPPPSFFLHHGSPGNKGSLMSPGVLSVAARAEVEFPAAENAKSSGRRRAFAEWIASPENPLTARVMVNRMWQHHFGEGIVPTPSNFGKSGMAPTHPHLLDWMATEFIRQGWSIKAMHRLMMTSNAYRMASDDIPKNAAADPANTYLWRMPRLRLEGEIIRDSILALAGTLDRKMGGPGIFPYIDPALWQSSSGRKWPGRPDSDPETWRRSIYIYTKRTIPLPMLDVFDKPDTIGSCPRRNRSTIAPQALILMNNSWVQMQAKQFAQRLQREAGGDAAAQVERAYQLALARSPSPSERAHSIRFITSDPFGLVDFCQTIFNLNEFVYMP